MGITNEEGIGQITGLSILCGYKTKVILSMIHTLSDR